MNLKHFIHLVSNTGVILKAASRTVIGAIETRPWYQADRDASDIVIVNRYMELYRVGRRTIPLSTPQLARELAKHNITTFSYYLSRMEYCTLLSQFLSDEMREKLSAIVDENNLGIQLGINGAMNLNGVRGTVLQLLRPHLNIDEKTLLKEAANKVDGSFRIKEVQV